MESKLNHPSPMLETGASRRERADSGSLPAIPCGGTRDEADNIWRVRGRGSDREQGAFLYFAKTRERADNCNSLPSLACWEEAEFMFLCRHPRSFFLVRSLENKRHGRV